MPTCPICRTASPARYAATPYHVCPGCRVWFQHPFPPKVYAGAHEAPGDEMSAHDKAVNDTLAGHLLQHVLRGKPGTVLDIGAKFPFLASRLQARGCTTFAMEADPDGFRYAGQLGVEPIVADFESYEVDAQWNLDLITMIHVFEHMYDPLSALRKLRQMVAPTGRVFLRLPDHEVSGFERDLTAGHYTIHPYFHALSSVLEALQQVRDCFVIEHTEALDGAGQRDIVLRPIDRAPTIGMGMICKNEARDLPRCLTSLQGVIDRGVIVDTGSTDDTINVVRRFNRPDFPLLLTVFVGASRQDESGDWKLWDFATARNEFVRLLDLPDTTDWLFWIDADDELTTPAALRRAAYWQQFDVMGCWIQSGNLRWIHHRLWRTGRGVHFKGRCHEYPVLGNCSVGQLDDVEIYHDAAPGVGESSNARNLRILLEEWAAEPSPRTAFYLACTHRDGGREVDAIEWYRKRVAMGVWFRDEWLFALLYQARLEVALQRYDEALATLNRARDEAPDWAEFIMEEATIAYRRGDWAEAMAVAGRAIDQPIPPTVLWREPGAYRDQPLRLISWCREHLGDLPKALRWAERARVAIGCPDTDWDARVDRLRALITPATRDTPLRVIALHRPGAIGDVVMTLNLIPALREANPGCQIWYFCDEGLGAPRALGNLMRAAGVDQVMGAAGWAQWSRSCERAINLIGYPLQDGYPERPMERHLLQYFAAEMGLPADALPALTLPLPPRPADAPDGPYITLQTRAGWSRYKEWPIEAWSAVVDACQALGLPVIHVGEQQARSLDRSIALVAHATLHLGIDSFCNHLTNYYWTDDRGNGRRVPGVIVWGSTQASAAGYPDNVNLSAGLPCQPCFRENPAISRMARGPCVNPPRASYEDGTPHACMAGVSVERVVEAVREVWDRAAVGFSMNAARVAIEEPING